MYRHPVFNLTCKIWHNGLIGQALAGPIVVPARAADVITSCQLYYPRYGTGGDFAVDLDHISITLRRAGYMQLRCPAGTDVRAPWGAPLTAWWTDLDLIECPWGSGRLYVAITVDDAHLGFTNEYRVAVIAQISDLAIARFLAEADALTSIVIPGDGASTLCEADSLSSIVSPGPTISLLPEADSLAASVGFLLGSMLPEADSLTSGVTAGSLASLPEADALSSAVSPANPVTMQLPEADALASVVTPRNPATMQLPDGEALDATVSHSGGSVTPGVNCGGATSISLPFTQTQSIAGGAQDWWTFNQTSGVTYHLRVTVNSGVIGSGNSWNGTCLSLNSLASVSPAPTACASWVAAVTGQVWIEIQGNLIGSGNYTVEVATGVC